MWRAAKYLSAHRTDLGFTPQQPPPTPHKRAPRDPHAKRPTKGKPGIPPPPPLNPCISPPFPYFKFREPPKHGNGAMKRKRKKILSAALMHGLGHQPGAWRVRKGPAPTMSRRTCMRRFRARPRKASCMCCSWPSRSPTARLRNNPPAPPRQRPAVLHRGSHHQPKHSAGPRPPTNNQPKTPAGPLRRMNHPPTGWAGPPSSPHPPPSPRRYAPPRHTPRSSAAPERRKKISPSSNPL